MSEENFIQHDVENKQLKEENKKLNENKNENENENKKVFLKKFKDANIQKLIEESKEIKSPNWLDKNKFKRILTIIDSNKFGHKNEIGELKYIDIKYLVNNIKDNEISEIDAKKHLNKLNIIKNSETKHRMFIPGQKELLYLFDLLDTILTDKTLMSSKEENKQLKEENEKLNKNKNENENKNKNEDEDDDDMMKILIHSNDYDEETMNQNKKNKIIKKLDDHLDKIIDKSKSFEDQIKSIRKIENLYDDYYYLNNFGDKELKFKIFKLRLAHLSNDIGDKLFEKIFGHAVIKLADKLINTTNKEKTQIIVKNIEKNKDKSFKEDEFVIQPQQCANLIDLILDVNEEVN